MDPLISIITPSFQQARFLRACIDSVLSQDYPEVEYIINDGGSDDGSVEILKSYGDRITWTSGPDGGQAAAINTGLKRSRGAILGYLNSDDVLVPGACRAIAEAFAHHPQADVIYGKAEMIGEDGQVLGLYRTQPTVTEELRADCTICQPAAFWRREIQDKVGLLDESLQTALDYDFWIRIHQSGGQFRFLDKVLAQSRDYPGTKTRRDRDLVFQEIFSISRRHLGEINSRWIESYLHYLKFETRSPLRWLIPRTAPRRQPLVRLIRAFSRRCR
ncbi:MAG: glycosyltransferase family 2 protein [Opitutaceae bacterium]